MPYVEYILTGGLEIKASPDRIQDGHLSRARGCVYDALGEVCSDPGRVKVADVGSEPVRGEGDATLNAVKYLFTKTEGNYLRGPTVIGAAGAGDGHLSVVPYNDYVYLADGEVFRRYSIAKGIEEVGLDPPDITGIDVTINASSSFFLFDGDYKWVITYYNGVAESNFSEPFTKTATGGDSATVPSPATWPASATEVRVYRTIKDQEAFFRVGTIEAAGGTFTDEGGLPYKADPDATEDDEVTDEPRRQDPLRPPGLGQKQGRYKKQDKLKSDYSDAQVTTGEVVQTNLGVLADWNDHDRPPDDIRHLIFITDRIYGISGVNTLRATRVVAPEHWSEYNSIPIGRQTGEGLRAIRPLGPDVICYTNSGIWRFRPQGEDLLQSQLIQLEAQVGLAAEWAVTDLEDGSHVFLGESAVYLFDGRAAREISFAVEKLFTDENHVDYIGNKANAVAASLRDKVWISYSTGGNINNRTLYVDLQDPQSPKFSVLMYGFATLRRNLDNRVIGGDYHGNVYELGTGELGTDEQGVATTFDITTKAFPFGGPTVTESYDRVVFDVNPGGDPMVVSLRSDSGQGYSYTLDWNGRRREKRWIPADLIGRRLTATFFSNSRGPKSVYGIGFGVESEGLP